MYSHYIDSCVCGNIPTIGVALTDPKQYFIRCFGGDVRQDCWKGPYMPTEKEAIEAWNTVMSIMNDANILFTLPMFKPNGDPTQY